MAPALPSPPTEGDNQAFSYRQVSGLNWRHLAGSILTLSSAERALQGAGLGAASSRALEFSLLDFNPWCRKGVSARPLVHLLQWSLFSHVNHFIFSFFIRYLPGTYCVPGLCLLCASGLALHKEVGSQPQGDAPSPRHLPFICKAAHYKRTRT